MTTGHFAAMADYNRWANARLYADAATLSPEAQTRDVGVYFGSAFATLMHGLSADRAWTHMLRGGNLADMERPDLPSDFSALTRERREQDNALVAWIATIDQDWLDRPFHFTSGLGALTGMVYEGTHASTLSHVFNHQTHHRGQAHAALTILGIAEPQGLDMLIKGFREA